MNFIDKHYYSSFDQIGQPFYDWERQIINLGCLVSDIDISNSSTKLSDEGLKHSSKLVHEYIHFLQNFSTAWGAPVFTDFALALVKIGASSAEAREEINLPLVKSELKNSLLIDGIVQQENVIKRLNQCNKSEFHPKNVLTDIKFDPNDETCAILDNGRIRVELGLKVIREHMAHMGTQLFLSKSDSDIHNYNKDTPGFKGEGIEFSNQPEYWILFEFLYSNDYITDIAKGVFHLTQQCLVTLNPEKAMLRFLNWLVSDKSNIHKKKSLVQLVEVWLQHDNEIYYLHLGLTKSIEHCEKILALANKHRAENDIFQIVYDITEYSIANIKKTTGGRFLYKPNDNLSDINYWKNKIATFGTGIIIYLDNTLIHGSKNHCSKMMKNFNFLVSCSLVIKKILDNQKSTCPFLDDIPICKAEFRDSANCRNNPFLMIQKDDSGKECLFGNGVILMGMEDRINFQ